MKSKKSILKWILWMFVLAFIAGIMWLVHAGTADPKSAFDLDKTKRMSFSEDELTAQNAIANRVNVLLIGADISEERLTSDREDYRSDVLLLISIDFDNKRADLISVPRDSYAPVYNTTGKWKINAAFAKGGGFKDQGPQYAMKTVSNLLCGIPVNYYVGVDMNSLVDVIDAIGGVDYEVDVRIKLNGRILNKGVQHLDGQQVLDYCRARKQISTDIGRNDRQQRMLITVFNELKEKDRLIDLAKIYQSMDDKIYSNLSLKQVIALVMFCKKIETEDISRYTLKGKYKDIYGANFYLLDMQYKNDIVKEIFGVEGAIDPKYDVNHILGKK